MKDPAAYSIELAAPVYLEGTPVTAVLAAGVIPTPNK
jgi:hypothetical protein